MRRIEVIAYDPKWQVEYDKAASAYRDLLQDLEVTIEHVGSTSVEGLWAKPILDIDVIVKDRSVSSQVIKRLEAVGYEHVGNYGIEGREAMKYQEGTAFIKWMTHHLYVCLEGTDNLINHLKLRKHLRESPSARQAYSDLKQGLAKAHPHDIDAYIQGKTQLITDILAKEGMSQEALDRIKAINEQ